MVHSSEHKLHGTGPLEAKSPSSPKAVRWFGRKDKFLRGVRLSEGGGSRTCPEPGPWEWLCGGNRSRVTVLVLVIAVTEAAIS